jgi:hypothetical protein
MRRIHACLVVLIAVPTAIIAQQPGPTFSVILSPTITTVSDTVTQVSYRLQLMASANDSLRSVSILSAVPVTNVLSPSIPANLAYFGTHEGQHHAASGLGLALTRATVRPSRSHIKRGAYQVL